MASLRSGNKQRSRRIGYSPEPFLPFLPESARAGLPLILAESFVLGLGLGTLWVGLRGVCGGVRSAHIGGKWVALAFWGPGRGLAVLCARAWPCVPDGELFGLTITSGAVLLVVVVEWFCHESLLFPLLRVNLPWHLPVPAFAFARIASSTWMLTSYHAAPVGTHGQSVDPVIVLAPPLSPPARPCASVWSSTPI